MSHHTPSDTDHASLPDQFADGETLVECYAGGRAGTGKTTQLVEWFRDQHDDEAAKILIDPADDARTPSVDVSPSEPLDIDPQHATYKYSVSLTWADTTDTEEESP